jgi:peptide/nickel transport system substrate-binding protein
MAELAETTDPAKRSDLLKQAQKRLADDYVNAFLFQLPKLGVANAKIVGLWKNQPTPANDMSEVYWKD